MVDAVGVGRDHPHEGLCSSSSAFQGMSGLGLVGVLHDNEYGSRVLLRTGGEKDAG
jgi:hypothetical protein